MSSQEAVQPRDIFRRPEPVWPQLLHVEEKHGEYFFLIKDWDNLYEVALKMLTRRLADGYWYYFDDKLPDTFEEYLWEKIGAKLSPEELSVFDKLDVKINGCESKTLISNYKRNYDYEKQNNAEYLTIKKTVNDNNGKLAWKILHNRDGQYEKMTLERFENVAR